MKTNQRPITEERLDSLLGQYIIVRGAKSNFADQIVKLNGYFKTPGYFTLQIWTKNSGKAQILVSPTMHKIAIIADQEEAKAAFANS